MTGLPLGDEIDRLKAENADLLEALDLILPLAKGYAAINRVGSNREYVAFAETVSAKAKGD